METNSARGECQRDGKKKKGSGGSSDEQTGCQHNLWGAHTLLIRGLETVRDCVQVQTIIFYCVLYNLAGFYTQNQCCKTHSSS